jgi:hypothetical protein
MLALAGSVHAIPGINSSTTIAINDPDTNELFTLPRTNQKLESWVNFSYTVRGDNNVSWCKLVSNNTQMAVNISIERIGNEYFRDIALTNGTWWYYIQCMDNYSKLYNSTNETLRIILDDTPPTVSLNIQDTTYNTTDGRTLFRFNTTEMETGIDNCTLFVEDEERGKLESVGNNSRATFPELVFGEGDYMWYVVCQDNAGNIGKSTHGLLIGELIASQTIFLNSPPDQAVDLDTYVTFKYTPASRLQINWCGLLLNETHNVTDNEIENATENVFEKVKLNHGPYNWSISCVDSEGNNVTSGKRELFVNRTILLSEYLRINISAPADLQIVDSGGVTIHYTPTAVLGLNRCELLTNRSVRGVTEGISSGEEALFSGVSFSEGIWEWRLRCFDNSGNEINSELRTLIVNAQDPEPIINEPDKKISGEIEDKDITEILSDIKGRAKGFLGMSNAAWLALVIIVVFLGVGASVIVTDKKFELELIKDVQLVLYKLKIRKDPPNAKKKNPLTVEHKKALKDYITYHMKNGVARVKIEDHLRSHEWRNNHIKEVFDELEEEWDEWRDRFVEKE